MSVSITEFKSAMSLYPTGVAVVTSEPEGFASFGMTVNSFTSLSLEPPLVMWNLQKSSDTFKAWRDAESFAVNFLKADQQDLSTHFALKGPRELAPNTVSKGVTGCPLLKNSLASLECTMHARYEEGDHVIMIGEVVNLTTEPGAPPLVYLKGGYTSVL